jgi:hypothetical protein
MPNGKLREYYGRITAFLAECSDYLDTEHSAFIFPDEYAYIYYDPHGRRIFQYDDAPHHPEISTYPHHLHRGAKVKRGKERVYAIDLPRVDFIAMVEKAIGQVR